MFLQLVLRETIILWSQSLQQHVRIDQDCLGMSVREAVNFGLKKLGLNDIRENNEKLWKLTLVVEMC